MNSRVSVVGIQVRNPAVGFAATDTGCIRFGPTGDRIGSAGQYPQGKRISKDTTGLQNLMSGTMLCGSMSGPAGCPLFIFEVFHGQFSGHMVGHAEMDAYKWA
jgi:hypothetical protein